ncbi:MAG TPA: DUF484 family protein [Steroidobacteraceae bacterium]|jgi:uncharacterized protein YigA (DUF484 family)|nr:DUF484 family protein [Steroidobacteraceae bacterium]
MTTREARGLAAADAEEESIATYLQRNPDFFERHQGVLVRLKLPHVRGGATISLVERQIEVLREKLAGLEGKLAELLRVARANDAIAERLHRFTRRLVRDLPRDAAIARIETGLREDFDAFHAVLVLIGAQAEFAGQRFVRSVPADDPNLKSFESLFTTGKPRCGQARDSQRDFLFGPEGTEMASLALVPLGDKGSLGLLALGSADKDRFHPGMSTEFLARLAELITDSLSASPAA